MADPGVVDFYVNMFKKCGNGKIPTAKLNAALARMHAFKPVAKTEEHSSIWVPNTGASLSGIGNIHIYI